MLFYTTAQCNHVSVYVCLAIESMQSTGWYADHPGPHIGWGTICSWLSFPNLALVLCGLRPWSGGRHTGQLAAIAPAYVLFLPS